MSDYGAVFKNNDGGIQIDSTYSNYIFERYMDSTYSYPYPIDYSKNLGKIVCGSDSWVVSLDPPIAVSKAPILACRPPMNADCWVTWYGHGGDGPGQKDPIYNYNSHGKRTDPYTPVQLELPCVIFIKGSIADDPEYGLLVKNAGGETVFNSDERYMKIIGVYPFTCGQGSSTNVTISNGASNYFAVFPYAERFVLAGAITEDYVRAWRISSPTNIVISDVRMRDISAPYASDAAWVNDGIVLEVNF